MSFEKLSFDSVLSDLEMLAVNGGADNAGDCGTGCSGGSCGRCTSGCSSSSTSKEPSTSVQVD